MHLTATTASSAKKAENSGVRVCLNRLLSIGCMLGRHDDGSRAAVEERTRLWIEANHLRSFKSLAEHHQNVWDAHGQPRRLTRYHFQEIQRKLKVFRWLDRLTFDSFLDVGSGFDVYPNLVRKRYGADAFFSDFAHSMNLPYGGARSGKLDRAVTLNSARLPFPDSTFDVVLASEVLEHLVLPVESIAELMRVSRKYVVMTSLEALSSTWWQRWLWHFHVDTRKEHVERNFLLLREFDALFGPEWYHENILYDPASPASAFDPEETQQATYLEFRDVDSLSSAVCRGARVEGHPSGSMGIVLVKARNGADVAPRRPRDDIDLVRWIIEETAGFERFTLSLASDMAANRAEIAERDRPVAESLLARLCCPDCRSPLERASRGLHCRGCKETFVTDYGVPILYPKTLRERPMAQEEALRQLCVDDQRRRAILRRLMRRLRRAERAPGKLRRFLWWLTRRLGLAPS